MMKTKALTILAGAAIAGRAAACSSSGGNGGSTNTSSGAGVPKVNLTGKSYTILGQWTGAEQKAFQAVITAFDKKTGAKGTYTPAAGGDEATVLGTQVNGGTPPDIAMLALPGAISQYAKAGKIQPLSSGAQSAVSANFASIWSKLATVDGKVYG